MENQSVMEKVKELIAPLIEDKGIELVDVNYRQEGSKMILRVFVDKATGITLDECAILNEEIGSALDEDNAIATSYILEVSSPGLDRPLKTKRDFERAIGKKMDVFLKDRLGDKLQYYGTLDTVEDDSIILQTKSGLVNIPLEIINKGKLDIDFGK